MSITSSVARDMRAQFRRESADLAAGRFAALSVEPEVLPPAAPTKPAPHKSPVGLARRIWTKYHAAIRGCYSVLLALVAWELIGRYLLTSKLMFAPLSAVLAEFAKLWSTGE